jgi:hypothetical protein
VPLEGQGLLAGGRVPHRHRLVIAAAGQALAVGARLPLPRTCGPSTSG